MFLGDSASTVRASRIRALAVGAMGAVVLLGWCFEIGWLVRLHPSWPGMAPTTAIGFSVIGSAIWLHHSDSPRARRGSAVLAALAVGFAALRLVGWFSGGDGRGGLVMHVTGAQVAPVTALSFAALGGALLAVRRASPTLSQGLALIAAATGVIGALRYVYDSPLTAYAPMALHTCFAVMMAATAILRVRPDAPLLVILRDAGSGGMMMRRLLPLVVAAPVVLGGVLLHTSLDTRTYAHVLAPLYALMFAGLLWWTAQAMRRSENVRDAEQSARRLAEQGRAEEHERFLLLTRATLDTVIDWDVRRDTLWVSGGIERAFGWKLPGLVDRAWIRARIHPEDLRRMAAEMSELMATGEDLWTTEYRFLHIDGRYRNVLTRAIFLRDAEGKQERMISTLIDISDRIVTAQALRDRSAELERSNRELERFAQIASHDLQEPLRTISSFVQLLSKRYGDKLDQNGARYMHYVVDGAERMRALINALLTYSRVDRADAPVTAEVPLTKVMARVRADLRTAIAESHAEITHDELPMVLGNELQLAQLLSNILSNAIKYQAAETRPRIHIATTRESSHWKISVSDNGIGIDPQYFERIFVVFQRLHTREAYDGTGVGLAICKRIVERHGGKIWVDSQPGTGSTFHFTLKPAESSAEGGAHAESAA